MFHAKNAQAWVIFIMILLISVVGVSYFYEHYGLGVFIASLLAGLTANILFKLFIEKTLFSNSQPKNP